MNPERIEQDLDIKITISSGGGMIKTSDGEEG